MGCAKFLLVVWRHLFALCRYFLVFVQPKKWPLLRHLMSCNCAQYKVLCHWMEKMYLECCQEQDAQKRKLLLCKQSLNTGYFLNEECFFCQIPHVFLTSASFPVSLFGIDFRKGTGKRHLNVTLFGEEFRSSLCLVFLAIFFI